MSARPSFSLVKYHRHASSSPSQVMSKSCLITFVSFLVGKIFQFGTVIKSLLYYVWNAQEMMCISITILHFLGQYAGRGGRRRSRSYSPRRWQDRDPYARDRRGRSRSPYGRRSDDYSDSNRRRRERSLSGAGRDYPWINQNPAPSSIFFWFAPFDQLLCESFFPKSGVTVTVSIAHCILMHFNII